VINNLLRMLTERLGAWIPVVAVSEDSGVWQIMRQEVLKPHLPIVRRPCILPVAAEAVDSDNVYLRIYSFGQQFKTKRLVVLILRLNTSRPAIATWLVRIPFQRVLQLSKEAHDLRLIYEDGEQ